MRHLIGIEDLSVAEIEALVATAEDIIDNPQKYAEVCHGKKLASLFYEPSTRTRLSFEAAMIELGGSVIGFSEAQSSSAAKGESVADTAKVISCFADIMVMRHFKEGAPMVASLNATVPVINAGDGGHMHPTQTLADIATIVSRHGRLENLTVGLCGDLMFGRTVHSLIETLCRFGNIRFVLISPDELKTPQYVIDAIDESKTCEYVEVRDMVSVISQLDILYMTRVQQERFFSEDEYLRLRDTYILDEDKLRAAKPDMAILHPLPRVNEIAVEVDDDPRAAYFEQVKNGMLMRMALQSTVLGDELPGYAQYRAEKQQNRGKRWK